MLVAGERVRLAAPEHLHALAFLDTADDGEPARVGDRGQELEVLAEPGVVDRRALRERDTVELDHAANMRPACDVARVGGDAVRDVHQRVGARRELAALGDTERWTG